MTQPLGYYGLNLDTTTELVIDNMHLHELTNFLDNITTELNAKHYLDNDSIPAIEEDEELSLDLSDLEKIELIRGLCDRIEQKLMEAAK